MKETKVYHVETQEAYDELMIELEEKCCKWKGGEKPTNFHVFKRYGKNTYIYDEYGVIQVSSGDYFKEHYNNEPVIEYKAKGENMTQEKMKQNIIDWGTDVFVAVGLFARDIKFEMKKSTVEADLNALKELVEKSNAEDMTDAQVADIKAAQEKLMQSAQQLFAKMYEQAQAAQGAAGAGPDMNAGAAGAGPDMNAGASNGADDDVIDADFKEV